ncbi:SH3 domain-binding protein 2 [Aplochiton taeniatus]
MAASVRKKKLFALDAKPSVRMGFREPRDFVMMASVEVSWPVPMRAIGAQNLLTMPGGVTYSGYLHKKGGSQFSLMKWPLRYIIIHKGCVYYFKTSTSAAPQGAFSLNGYNRVMRAAEETTSSNVFPFKIVHFSKKHRTWLFSAASEDERRKWMKSLRKEIDHYNDRRDSNIQSDSDLDADSFYGSIERPMDIKHSPDNPDDDYMMEDDDEDEEDYLKPDSPQQSTDGPPGPPPSYPPPLAPAPSPFQLRQDSCPGFFKGLPPPLPQPNKTPTSPFPKKPPPSFPPPSLHHQDSTNKGPPPPLPYTPHLQKPSAPSPPPPPPPAHGQPKEAGPAEDEHHPGDEEREERQVLSANRLSPEPRHSAHLQPIEAAHGSGQSRPRQQAQAAPPSQSRRGQPLRRRRRQGQSAGCPRTGRNPALQGWTLKPRVTFTNHAPDSDSDDDYENVLLPDSVFVETTETSCVEKLFKDTSINPQDGLYCIRKSGTKTSKVLVVWDISLNKARNYRLFTEESRVFLECDLTFPSLAVLIEHYHAHPLPNHGSLCLQRPYGYTPPSGPLPFDLGL